MRLEIETEWKKNLALITAVDTAICEEAKKHWDTIAKPLGSLGRMEEAIVRVAGIYHTVQIPSLKKTALAVMCADHGVVEEGVTQSSCEVTAIVAENFTKHKTSAVMMAAVSQTDVFPVDIGIKIEIKERLSETPKPFYLLQRNIARGSNNIAREAAMTVEQAKQAMLVGIELVRNLKKMGYQMIATGEMGIGNTTPSSAMAAIMLQRPAEEVTGKGAGLSNADRQNKVVVVQKAMLRYQKEVLQKEELRGEAAVELLAQLGGYDIAGMAGLFLGGAIYQIPILVDGFISAVSALVASRIEPKVQAYMIGTHASGEPAGKVMLAALGIRPLISCEMRLGEGTGAVAAIPILQMAAAVYNEMTRFDETEIEPYQYL